MWWLVWDAIIARLEWGVAGGMLACAAIGCGKPPPEPTNSHQVIIPASGSSGRCHVEASLNGHQFSNVLLDSGADGTLTMGKNQAKELGFPPEKLSYSHGYSSANGNGKYASVTLREFRFRSFVLHDVEASITASDQSEILVGVEILHKLNFQLNNGYCLLSLPDSSTTTASLAAPIARPEIQSAKPETDMERLIRLAK